MPKSNAQSAEPNDEVVRIRMTKTMKESFEAFCSESEISDASAGRTAIYRMIKDAHLKRTGQPLEEPDINPRSWPTKRS